MKKAIDYIGISRIPNINIKNSNIDSPSSYLYKIKNFFTSDIFGWIFHDFWIRKRYKYPSKISTKPIQVEDIKIGIAADWGSGTIQSQYVGECLNDKNTDFTIHLGDTYFSGTKKELDFSFGKGDGDNGLWPRGRLGSFALCGNHEMFSSGSDYYEMITSDKRGWGLSGGAQESPVFCIKTPYWCILGLDTGFDSLQRGIIPISINPDNKNLKLQDSVIDWLINVVDITNEKRGIIVLTHHQYISAFNGEDEFVVPASQLKTLLPEGKEIIWIWGHEHRFSIYNRFQLDENHITAYGRCIGNGGMPDEHIPQRSLIQEKAKSRNLLLYDNNVAETFEINKKKIDVGYNGYLTMDIKDHNLNITYYRTYIDNTNRKTDQAIFIENWSTDLNGSLNLNDINHVNDLTLLY